MTSQASKWGGAQYVNNGHKGSAVGQQTRTVHGLHAGLAAIERGAEGKLGAWAHIDWARVFREGGAVRRVLKGQTRELRVHRQLAVLDNRARGRDAELPRAKKARVGRWQKEHRKK